MLNSYIFPKNVDILPFLAPISNIWAFLCWKNDAKMPVHKSRDLSGGEGGVYEIIIFDHKGGGGVTKDPKLDHEIYERPLNKYFNQYLSIFNTN